MVNAFIAGCAGLTLTQDERTFFAAAQPAGLILFGRNCQSPPQISALVNDFKHATGQDASLILVDQEGGRVQRLAPPNWQGYPAAARFGELHALNPAAGLAALDLISRLMASDLRACGINTNCAPVLDVIQPGAHDVIGDRAYGNDPATVTALGQVFADAHMASGIVPVMKHIPGHGRAPADSHVSLPVVDAPLEELVRTDFLPFETLRQLPAAMVGHVLYTELDPAQPASTSAPIVQEVIRHHVGFDGLLIADDVGMGALEGTMRERTARVLAAGLDLALHCNGALEEMEQVAEAAGPLGSAAQARYTRALSLTTQKHAFDRVAAMAILSEMMVQAA